MESRKGRQQSAAIFEEEDGEEVRQLHNAVGGWHNEERRSSWGCRRQRLAFGGGRWSKEIGQWAECVVGLNYWLSKWKNMARSMRWARKIVEGILAGQNRKGKRK
jgi:hypothetical protein